jgi:aspartyl-tRNA(Asn)/glutamyl-tRNA(Gln) amidotransferase subunit C
MPSRITTEDIKKLATLARMKLSPEEEADLAGSMDDILGYVDQIKEVSGTFESTEKEKTRNVMRPDEGAHESGIHTAAILAEAPAREGDYVKVKKIL